MHTLLFFFTDFIYSKQLQIFLSNIIQESMSSLGQSFNTPLGNKEKVLATCH